MMRQRTALRVAGPEEAGDDCTAAWRDCPDQNSVIIDVGGVGYAVTVSGRTQGTLAAAGGTVTLLTDMQVR